MAHKRTKSTPCQKCGGTCHIKANLDTGKVEEAWLPEQCKWPNKCPSEHAKGVFDRPFGERLIRPELNHFKK